MRDRLKHVTHIASIFVYLGKVMLAEYGSIIIPKIGNMYYISSFFFSFFMHFNYKAKTKFTIQKVQCGKWVIETNCSVHFRY